MPGLPTCHACHGFVADLAQPCVHCGAVPPRRRALARFLATAVFGVTAAVTLMACYGATYDCYDNRCTSYCTTDSQCLLGEYCDPYDQSCEWSGTCSDDAQCADGYRCDPTRGTCVPGAPPCDSHDDCDLPYERCDLPSGTCVASSPCAFDGATCGLDARCDPAWGVCVPCAGTECGWCDSELTCDRTAPACPEGSQPAIEAGCYTAACIPTAVCLALMCAPLDETTCAATEGCDPTYVGINCTNPDGGGPCTAELCVCESYEFDACAPANPPPP